MKKTLAILLGILLGVFSVPSAARAGLLLLTSDSTAGTLYALDPGTGSSTAVGAFGVDGYMAGLAFDPLARVLYGTTTATDKVYEIDYSTGAASLVGDLGATLMHALAYDASSQTLYGAFGEEEGDGLYEIDVATGSASLIGHIGFFHGDHGNAVHGLAINPGTDSLYGAVSGPAGGWYALIEIDKATAAGTLIGEGTPHMTGLAFHPQSHALYGIDNWSSDLYTIDISTGAPTLIGSSGLSNPLGLEFIPEPASIMLLGLGGLALVCRRQRA